VQIIVAAATFWLVIMLAFLFADYVSRGWLGFPQGW